MRQAGGLRPEGRLLALRRLRVARPMNAHEMVMRCFRHQHPEAYGRAPVADGIVPPELRYGRGEVLVGAPEIREEPMGNGEVMG